MVVVVRSPCQENYPADAHLSAHKSVLESANPAWTRSVHLDAPGQRHGQQPVSGTADPGLVKQDKSSRGSIDTTKTRSGPQRVRMSSGERPIGATKGKQSDTEALCQPPPPVPPHPAHPLERWQRLLAPFRWSVTLQAPSAAASSEGYSWGNADGPRRDTATALFTDAALPDRRLGCGPGDVSMSTGVWMSKPLRSPPPPPRPHRPHAGVEWGSCVPRDRTIRFCTASGRRICVSGGL